MLNKNTTQLLLSTDGKALHEEGVTPFIHKTDLSPCFLLHCY